jgi:PTH1 family peptidyl-tRNA hydrolase
LADHLARRWTLPAFRRVPAARETRGEVVGEPVMVIKPQTYMNRSGAVLASLRSLPGFDPARDLLVLVDEFALPLGRFRLRGAGSPGGHNGLKSIEAALERQDYPRLRIGIGPLPPGTRPADFVLGEFAPDERAVMDQVLEPMGQAVDCWLADGIEQAMSRFNNWSPSADAGP